MLGTSGRGRRRQPAQLTIHAFLSEDSRMDSRCAMWCLVLGVAGCAPLPKQESATDTAVTLQPAVQEPSRQLEPGRPATLIEWEDLPESPHPKFSSDWRVMVIRSGNLSWERVPVYGAIQDWHK
jgi:hypothetical protein